MANGLQGRGLIRTISILPTGPDSRKNFSRLILKQTNGHLDPWESMVFRGCFGQETYRTATLDRGISWSMAYRPLGISGDSGRETEAKWRGQPVPGAPCRIGACPRSRHGALLPALCRNENGSLRAPVWCSKAGVSLRCGRAGTPAGRSWSARRCRRSPRS